LVATKPAKAYHVVDGINGMGIDDLIRIWATDTEDVHEDAISDKAVVLDVARGHFRDRFGRSPLPRLGDGGFPYQDKHIVVIINGVPYEFDSRLWAIHHLNPKNRVQSRNP
jgi:hypothetical protein